MIAEIVTIGDEILIGQIVDSNSAWMATLLNQSGIKVGQITSISDQPEHLVKTLDAALGRADVILMTGGLGPTNDDRTKNVLAEYFQSSLIMHQPTLDHIQEFFNRRGLPMNQLNKDQALVPEDCDVLFNALGTAPGMWFEKDAKIVVSMPGVPFEMKELMKSQIMPRLVKLTGSKAIVHRTVLTTGIPESLLAERLAEWERALPRDVHLAYLPNPGQIRLRFSAFGDDEDYLQKVISSEIDKLKAIIPEAIFGYENETLAGVVGKLLIEKGLTLAVSESCTGGLIAHSITSNPGSSEWFKGSVTAYSNEIKEKVLGVKRHSLLKNGAVSEAVVREMAEGVRKLFEVDYALATSGVAGPGGGTREKPVGTVWIAVAGPSGTTASHHIFSKDRERNIIRSSQTALDNLRHLLLE